MPKTLAVALLALALAGCGDYFDRHPANVRPENEAVAAVLANPPSQVADAAPQEAGMAEQRVAPATEAAPAMQPPVQTSPIPPAPAPVIAPPPPPSPAPVAQIPPSAEPVAPSAPVVPPLPASAVAVALPEAPAASAATSQSAPPAVVVQSQTTTETRVAVRPSPPPNSANASELPAAAPPATDHCTAVAKQRADDARAAGMDDDTLAIIRHGTYADCMAWATSHP